LKKKLYEEIVLFYGAIKWVILSTIIGIIVGIGVTVFLKLLHASINLTSKFEYYYILLPFALFITALIIEKITPEAKGHGTEKVIEAIHKRSGKNKSFSGPHKTHWNYYNPFSRRSRRKRGTKCSNRSRTCIYFCRYF